MLLMELDIRRPTLVLTGAWNPAIFQPGWVLQHVYGLPAGVEIDVTIMQGVVDGQPKTVTYFESIGLSVSQTRLEIYLVDGAPPGFEAAENAAKKVLELLPHTPVNAYGVNFFFREDKPSLEIREKISGMDRLQKHFSVVSECLISRISVGSKVDLNLRRQLDETGVVFDFNFHHSGMSLKEMCSSLQGEIGKRLSSSVAMLKKIYNLSQYEVVNHQFEESRSDHV